MTAVTKLGIVCGYDFTVCGTAFNNGESTGFIVDDDDMTIVVAGRTNSQQIVNSFFAGICTGIVPRGVMIAAAFYAVVVVPGLIRTTEGKLARCHVDHDEKRIEIAGVVPLGEVGALLDRAILAATEQSVAACGKGAR